MLYQTNCQVDLLRIQGHRGKYLKGVFAHPLKKVQFSCNLRHFIMKLCCQTERLSAILAPVDWYYNPI
jgi:hypothetical protein